MMKRYLDLVPISAKIHKRQSRMTRICITLAVFLVTVIFGMADMEIQNQIRQEINNNGNWHGRYTGLTQEQGAILMSRPEVEYASRYEITNYNMDEDYYIEGVRAAVCGIDEDFIEIMPASRILEGSFPSEASQAVLTNSTMDQFSLKLGDTFTLQTPGGKSLSFTISGIARDASSLLKAGAAGVYLNTGTYQEYFLKDGSAENWAYYIKFYNRSPMQQTLRDIREQLQLTDGQVQEHVTLLGLLGQSNDSYMMMLWVVAAVLAALVVTAGVLMIASSLNSNVAQRTQFFGMLRCLGASPKQIIRFVRLEALHWCRTSIPIGLLCGVIVIWGLSLLLKFLSPRFFSDMPAFSISWISLAAGTVIGLVTVLLSSSAPAKRAAKVSPLTAVSGNTDAVQLAKKAASTRFFKVETTLGIHHAKSSKKNLFLMVGSFSFSIILFLAFTSSIDFMKHAIKPLQPYTPDLSIISRDNTCSVPEELMRELTDNPQIKRVYGRMFAYDIPVAADGEERIINLISYEQHQFQWAEGDLLEGNLEDVKNGTGVAVCYNSGKPLKPGDTVLTELAEGSQSLTVSALLSYTPFSRKEGVDTVICSEELFRKLTGETGYTIIDIQLNRGATDSTVEEIRALAGEQFTFSDQRMSNNEVRGTMYSFSLFLYGFLAVIALIAIFNIINSIAMSVSARLKQYGAMRAIGMSDRQVIKMVIAETVTYILSGILLGCLLGLPLNRALYENLVTSRWGTPWYLPLGSLITIVLVVIFSAVLAVRGPAKRIRGMSIVDTIGAE